VYLSSDSRYLAQLALDAESETQDVDRGLYERMAKLQGVLK
jgi:hypothetical protein